MLMLFHPPTWKINDTADPLPPSAPLSPARLNEFKTAQELSRTLQPSPSSVSLHWQIRELPV